MDIRYVDVIITEEDNFINLSSEDAGKEIGTTFDDNATVLRFTRPASCVNDDLSVAYGTTQVLIGKGNEFPVPQAATTINPLPVRVVFSNGEGVEEVSNTIMFRFRKNEAGGRPSTLPTGAASTTYVKGELGKKLSPENIKAGNNILLSVSGDDVTISASGGSGGGEPGTAATVAIGTVTTGEPGSLAQVTNVGTENAAVFNFVVPKGADGVSGGGSVIQSANLFNKDDPAIITGAYANSTGGQVVDARYYISHKIAVTPGEKYTVRYAEYQGGVYYKSDDTAISRYGTPSGTPNISPFTFTAPANAAYVRMNGLIAKIGEDMLVAGDTYPIEYSPFGTLTTSGEPSNPLTGKTVLWDGDSICYGAGFSGGYAGIISTSGGMLSTNYARSGATVAGGTTLTEGGNRHWISQSVGAMSAQADYIIFQGGINDYWLKVPLGAVTSGYADAFDDTTFAGAMENMFKLARTKWPSGKIGFIVTFKISGTTDIINGTKAEKYWDIARKACKKWSIPCFDLYEAGNLNFEISAIKNAYSMDQDGCHPNEGGYKIIAGAIAEWMKSL